MGAQIAAHLANAGIETTVCDVTLDTARAGLDRLSSLKPDPFFSRHLREALRPGALDDPATWKGADWVIEAVVEDLAVKRGLLERIEPHLPPGAVISSNTSAIPLADIGQGRSEAFRRRWLGTHFFNPPRYLPLVELIPTPDTDPGRLEALRTFLDHRLGKGVVVARDTPGFIANRLGVFGAIRSLEAVASGEFSIEEIDAVTGPLIGRPKSATFRTMDIAGLDILLRVADDLADRLAGRWDAQHFRVPGFVRKMVDRGLLGEKSGAGFFRRTGHGAAREIQSLDLESLRDHSREPVYRARTTPNLPGVDQAAAIGDPAERLRRLFLADDRTGQLLRRTLGQTLAYATRIAPEIANSIDDVDRAMRWGFGWPLGPFETWDAIGVDAIVRVMGLTDPITPRFRQGPLPPVDLGTQVLTTARAAGRVVKRNAGASLVDLGDGIVCIEFHSKVNTLGGDAMEMILAGVDEAAKNFAGIVIGTEADLFSAGANLALLLIEAQEGNWDEVDLMVRTFQRATVALKRAPVPVVAAPAGLALGGGCEICLHCDRVQAAAETYMGLVEAGVGLIPAGGGTTEMLLRAVDRAGPGPVQPHVQAAFETMALGKVSTSALDARRLGYLRDADAITMNRERAIGDAKAVSLQRARAGYQPARPRTVAVEGADGLAILSLGVHLAHRAGRASDHDALVARKLAWIMSGGNLPHRAVVTEEYLRDLEREAFLSLCGEPRTLERIGYTLKTGRTLRN
jgi:3-hydroxyacyl-CoA dehydrogenase